MLCCSTCMKTYDDHARIWHCSCGGPLEYAGTGDRFPESMPGRTRSIWRYREAIPVGDDRHIVTLGEGMTPVIRLDWQGFNVCLKLDYLCPSGSYKDRGTSVMVSVLKEMGVTAVVEDSSGNAGASVAAYAARAGMDCTVFVPEDTSPSKLAQIRAYGAHLVEVAGTRQDVADACRQRVNGASGEDLFYASHNWNPFFIEGMKTLAYEIWEQYPQAFEGRSGGSPKAPDWIVVPAGYGSVALGVYRGFLELFRWGRIDRIPRLAAVQATNCAPVYEAFLRGSSRVDPIRSRHTAAEGIACSKPVRGGRILEATRESGGLVAAVGEEEIRDAAIALARKGIYSEPTSAVVLAAIERLILDEVVAKEDNILGVLTGIGLKATDYYAGLAG